MPLKFEGYQDATTAFGKMDIYIDATRNDKGVWNVSARGTDIYDFKNESLANPFLDKINKMGYAAQQRGVLSNFTTSVNFTQQVSQTYTVPVVRL